MKKSRDKKAKQRRKYNIKMRQGFAEYMAGKRCPTPPKSHRVKGYPRWIGWMNARDSLIHSTLNLLEKTLPTHKIMATYRTFRSSLDKKQPPRFFEPNEEI